MDELVIHYVEIILSSLEIFGDGEHIEGKLGEEELLISLFNLH
jgi:hypothetical protein